MLCPFCDKEISGFASKCPYCHSDLDEYFNQHPGQGKINLGGVLAFFGLIGTILTFDSDIAADYGWFPFAAIGLLVIGLILLIRGIIDNHRA